jgi:hypothetical protein
MAKDVAQRDLDNAGFRISNLGNPKETGDATKTDNQSTPKPNAATGSPGTSLLAAAADHVHPATTTAPIIHDGFVDVSDPSYQVVKGKAEEVIAEFNVDLSGITGARVAVALSAIVKSVNGNGTFNVRMGGAPGVADGTVIATLATTSNVFITSESTVPGANPGRHQLIKLTAFSDADNGEAHIYGKTIEFRIPSVE